MPDAGGSLGLTGADGFLLKRARPAEIVHAVRLVADGDSWKPELLSVVPGADVAPPEASGK